MNDNPADQQPEEEDYVLAVPFIVTASRGAAYDDAAFVAGYQCGDINRALHAAAALNPPTQFLTFTVRTDLVRQLELIAMNAGFPTMTVETPATGWREYPATWREWSLATFSRGKTADHV